MTVAEARQRPVGRLLRGWRVRRRLSQLELAIAADISTRHLSFVETGRAMPSRDMVLRLADQLDVPLRERNQLLLAAGYAPVYPRTPLDSPALDPVRAAVRRGLAAHEPYPAVALDQGWHLIDTNHGAALLTTGAAEPLLAPPVNMLRLTLHPAGLAPRILNLGQWRAQLLGRLRRQVELTGDPELADLYDELRDYPCDQPEPELAVPGPGDVLVPLRIRDGERRLSFFSTVSTFATPLDVTVAELSVESFFPLDQATTAAFSPADGPGTPVGTAVVG
ncbi:helix-turn-helix domain-containing protein [Plantactinospora sonchi]|uniref:Helix-turn-helix transcriptional regulator n=1 Tax=Plantactinospora sonchi TaxID=1544735 RepID=A0ABU7RZN3_9ACTN